MCLESSSDICLPFVAPTSHLVTRVTTHVIIYGKNATNNQLARTILPTRSILILNVGFLLYNLIYPECYSWFVNL